MSTDTNIKFERHNSISDFNRDNFRKVIYEDRTDVKNKNKSLRDGIRDLQGDFITFYKYNIKWETLVNIIFSIIVISVEQYFLNDQKIEASLNWSVISFIIIFPLVFAIGSSQKRREEAIDAINKIRVLIYNISTSQVYFEWNAHKDKVEYNKEFQLKHQDNLIHITQNIIDNIKKQLFLDPQNAPFQFFTKKGRKIRNTCLNLNSEIRCRLVWEIKRLNSSIETLRSNGMDFPRANSIQQASWKILNNFEVLRRVKEYDTPYAMRSFARIYIFLLPIFYGPYFIFIANQTNLFISLLFNMFTMIGITSLFHILDSLETPFDEEGIDDIRVTSETIQFKNDMQFLFVKSDQFRSYEEQIKIDKFCEIDTFTITRKNTCDDKKHTKNKKHKKHNHKKHSFEQDIKDVPDKSHNVFQKFGKRITTNKLHQNNDENKYIQSSSVIQDNNDQQNDEIQLDDNKSENDKNIMKKIGNYVYSKYNKTNKPDNSHLCDNISEVDNIELNIK